MTVDFVAIGSIIIDDIIDPGGGSNMGMLGGGGSHAVAGMRVWSRKIALVSVIGDAFPETAMHHLKTLADTRGIMSRSVPQPRAWQLFEADGTRNELFRTDFDTFLQISVRSDEYPADFATARGVYLQTATAGEAEAWITRLKQLNPAATTLWEPWEIFYAPNKLLDFCQVAPLFDIVSPQTVEVSWMLEEDDPKEQALILFDCGVRCLALRLGSSGSLVGTASSLHHVPALTVSVVDETGAGNAYCGGFLIGYVESGGDILLAGQYGTVAATYTLAQVGVPIFEAGAAALAEARLQQLVRSN
jgi:sugar/nucleoside kinase (ribokinase family)